MDDQEIRARLDEVAHALRPLHKALVDLVRADYEKQKGVPIAGPVQLFQLLTQDPFFLWLHPMSALMAEIDELHDQKEPVAPEAVAAARAALESLVSHRDQEPSPDSFVSRYLEILQNEPEVVMVHARLRRALDRLHSS
ncbi:MAG TPA: hypothetical protein VGL86_01105 [Polyangia bacterium]|jgi:hypothetical protein